MGRTSAPGLAPQDTPAAAVQPLLRTQGLSLRAAGRWLIKGLDWEVRAGERWCVIGRNATGKSTLLRALAGLPVPERQGQVFWLGRPQADWPAADAALLRAFAPQQAADRFPVSVQQLLALSTVRPGALRAAEVLAALDAAGLAERGVLQLSGGERQRVALAQCALQGAPLMLMDEPVSFQDPAHQAQVSRWLAQLVADSVSEPVPESVTHSVTDSVAPASPAALVLTAHDVNWIARTATHVLALSSGPSDTQQGRWHAGTCADLLNAALLEQVYGCPWRSVGGFWVAD